MIDEKILKSPELPEIVKSAFFDSRAKFEEVEKNSAMLKKSAIFNFLIAGVIFAKPLAFTIFSLYFLVSNILAVIFFFSLVCELFILREIWSKRSNFSLQWLPLICLAQLLSALITGEFIFAGFLSVFLLLELIFIINPLKTQKIELADTDFFTCLLWKDARKYYLWDKAIEFANFRIQKVRGFKALISKEKRAFKNWLVLIIYPIVVIFHCLFLAEAEDSTLFILSALAGSAVFGILVYQHVKKDFEPFLLLAFSLLAAVNINAVISSEVLPLLAVDVFFICAFLSLVFRYFRNFLLIKKIDYNFYDLVELLSHEDENISKLAHEILQAETKLDLPPEPSIWLENLCTQN